MKTIFLAATFLFSIFSFSQQPPEPYWQRTLGGFGMDYAVAFVRTFDNGYAVLSSNYQSMGGDVDDINTNYQYYLWVVKIDDKGTVLWQNKINNLTFPSLGESPVAVDIIQAKDRGLIVLGSSWAIKYDKDGNFLWKYEYPNTGALYHFKQALENPDGTIMICGYNTQFRFSAYRGWVLCLEPGGQLKWERSFASTNPTSDQNLFFETIDTSFGGGYIVAGSYDTTGGVVNQGTNVYVAKISSTGDKIWFRTYGGKGVDAATDILPLTDGTYMVATTSTSLDGDVGKNHCYGNCQTDIWMLKIDKQGNILNKIVYGDFDTEKITDMVAYNGHVYLVGYTNSDLNGFATTRGQYDVWGLQLDYDLNIVSQHSFFGGPKNDWGVNVMVDSTGDEILPVILATTESESGGQVEGFHNGIALNDKDVWIFKPARFNTIKGYAFYDYNKNGVKESTEPYYKRGIFETTGDLGTLKTFNVAGTYLFKVKGTAYTTQLQTNDTAFTIVPVSKKSTFNNYFNVDSIHFALQLKPGFSDISAAAYPITPSRPGFVTKYEAMLTNRGGDTVRNKEFFILKDSLLTFNSATPAPLRTTADSIIWQYAILKPTDTLKFTVSFTVAAPPAAQIGDTLRNYFFAPLTNDVDTVNNKAALVQVVQGSYDPNDKSENHNGKLDASGAAKGEFLTYVIRFQNTGNDTAFTVVIKDTLDKNLDVGALELLTASHPYTATIVRNTIQWTFSNINLPDSNRNEPASHGHVTYRIRIKEKIPAGTTIRNAASIYFDFNLPIVTNTVTTQLWSPVTGTPGTNPPGTPTTQTSLVTCYPNPTSSSLNLLYAGDTPAIANIQIYDIFGKGVVTLSNQQLQPSSALLVNLPALQSGIYIIRLTGNNINETYKILIAK